MDQDAAPAPKVGALTETDTSSHIVGDLAITYRVSESPESLDPADTLGFLDLKVIGPSTGGLPAEVQIETDADGCVISLCLDYSAADVLRGQLIDLCRELRAEVTR
jgi:hypothetical protein